MDFGAGSYAFGFAAGILSTLSPCVLPIVPILLGSATNAHPRAPLVLAAGLALSYAVVGGTLAWAGSNLGVDPTVFISSRSPAPALSRLLSPAMYTMTVHRFFAFISSQCTLHGRLFEINSCQ